MTKIELLNKFFDNRCSEEEAKKAIEILEAEPGLVDNYLNSSEWDNTDSSTPLKPAIKVAITREVRKHTNKPVYKIVKPVFAAAAVLSALVFGLIYLNSLNSKSLSGSTPVTTITENTSEYISNKGKVIKKIKLEDGSVISLYPGSSVSFNKAFLHDRRILLNGKAVFDVKKNSESPFIVFSGAVSTTAIGTRFLVDDTDAGLTVNIQLFEGVVLVKPVDSSLMMNETLLEAGQQCFVNTTSRVVTINQIYLARKTDVANPQLTSIRSSENLKPERQILEFNKVPMQDVLLNLEARFGKKIEFSDKDIDENFFTGIFTEYDSLETILSVISMMNELEFSVAGEIIKARKVARKPVLNQTSFKDGTDRSQADMMHRLGLEIIEPRRIVIPIADRQIASIEEGDNGVRFNTVSLPALLDELQKQTPRKILFNREDLDTINFTGKLLAGESVKNNLRLICQINGLKLIIKRNSFSIEK